jgi:hypothetical protein
MFAVTHTLFWTEKRAELRAVVEIGFYILLFSFSRLMLIIYN